jgi:ADP-ribosylglycohydrolase
MTIATADAILSRRSYKNKYLEWGQKYPNPRGGYGASFKRWLESRNPQPYNSWGNGAAMRVAPIGLFYRDIYSVFDEATSSAACSHDHREGIKGAMATAGLVYMAKSGYSKMDMLNEMRDFGYEVFRTLDEIRPGRQFDESCMDAVPVAFRAFYESTDYEDAIRNAVSVGGDSDTIAAITGGIALAYYQAMKPETEEEIRARLPEDMLDVIERWGRMA